MLRPMSLAAFLDLHGERALVVGGGRVALRRTRTLLEAGLKVTVVAPELHPELAALPVETLRRAYQPLDLHDRRVVVCATDRAEVNDAVAAGARAAGVLARLPSCHCAAVSCPARDKAAAVGRGPDSVPHWGVMRESYSNSCRCKEPVALRRGAIKLYD